MDINTALMHLNAKESIDVFLYAIGRTDYVEGERLAKIAIRCKQYYNQKGKLPERLEKIKSNLPG